MGSNTPVSTNPPDFGFNASGQTESGDLILEILVPNNEDTSPSSLNVTIDDVTASTDTGASLVSSTVDWSTGQLDSYLVTQNAEPSGFSGQPTNSIGAYLDNSEISPTTGADPGATGFFVYQVDLGTQTLTGSGGPDLTLLGGLPKGSYITAFLVQNSDYPAIATANSGDILLTGTPTIPSGVPEPSSLLLLGTGIVGLAMMVHRRILPAGNLG